MNDYTGYPIPEGETPDTRITVWEIWPSRGGDVAWIRSYQEAMQYAKDVVESIMDNPSADYPVMIKINQKQMTLRFYEEITDA